MSQNLSGGSAPLASLASPGMFSSSLVRFGKAHVDLWGQRGYLAIDTHILVTVPPRGVPDGMEAMGSRVRERGVH